ncbi:MAG: hypothetical protein KIS79_09590 [Burkholderiales bacterium]|nr:hypothetical protein [Burkholderiales bacterium]
MPATQAATPRQALNKHRQHDVRIFTDSLPRMVIAFGIVVMPDSIADQAPAAVDGFQGPPFLLN